MPSYSIPPNSPDEGGMTESSPFFYLSGKGEERPLDEDHQKWLVEKITSSFDRLERDKRAVTQRWKTTKDAIHGINSKLKGERFSGLVPFGKQSLQTLVSHFWGRSLQTDKILFSLRGKTEESQEYAPIQKQNLIDLLKKDRFQQKMDDAVYESVMKGCVIGHVGFEEKTQKLRVLSGQMGTAIEYDENDDIAFTEVDKKIKCCASLTVVDPYEFVFDTTSHRDWDSCFKAYRRFMVYEDIASDANFINFEDLKDLTTLRQESKGTKFLKKIAGKSFSNKIERTEQNRGIDDTGRLEVIEFHGDIRLKDGTYLRNFTIVVAGREKVIRFEENPYYICPFVKWTYENTDDGWGMSPLEYIVPLIQASSVLLNSSVEAAKLSINPPWLAAKGMLPQKRTYLTEGKVIEYNQNTTLPNATPQPVQFNYQSPFPFLQLFEGQSESTTGATRQLSGNVTSNDKVQTATEFQGLQVVGNLIIDRVVDLFNVDFKIPVIEKMALITSMFNPENRSVVMENENGVEEVKEVTPEVYYGEYEYYIDDNKAETERKQNLNEKISLFSQMLQDKDISMRLKKVEFAKDIWRDMGYGNAGTYFMNDEELISYELTQGKIAQFVQMAMMQTQPGQPLINKGDMINGG